MKKGKELIMITTLKRALAVVLVFVSLLSLCPGIGTAAEVSDSEKLTITGAAASSIVWDPSAVYDGNISSCWSSSSSKSASTEQWIYLKLSEESLVSKIRLYPRVNGAAFSFPTAFYFQYSLDGSTWTDVPGGAHSGYAAVPDWMEFAFAHPVAANYIRMVATSNSTDGTSNYYFQLGEAELYGKTSTGSAGHRMENVALHKTVYATSSNNCEPLLVDGDTKYQWELKHPIDFLDVNYDGKTSKLTPDGYYYKEEAHIIVDLGASYLLDSFTVYDLQNLTAGPRDYLFDLSLCNDADFTVENQANANWTLVGSPEKGSDTCITNIRLPKNMVARYIKLDNLRSKGAWSFAVSELQAFGMALSSVEAVKNYAADEIVGYQANVELNAAETEARNAIIAKCTEALALASTVEEILEIWEKGCKDIDAVVAFAEYRAARIAEISDYKNVDGMFSDADRKTQLAALEKAAEDISKAADKAEVDSVVDDYVALVDSFVHLSEYEIIPSPHSISYANACYPFCEQIHVVRTEGTLDRETIDYIYEIFGRENVTFSGEKADSKLNLYLTSDDKEDAVEAWIRNTYGEQVRGETLEKSEAHIIFADENGISIIGNDAEGLFRGLTTIKFIKEQIESNPNGYRGFVINDYADMPFRGLIEGYYGLPWSWEEKADLLAFGSDFKMNRIVYAPKDDPYHVTKWKDLYPDKSEDPENNIQNVTIAAQTARRYKADLVWTAHCFGYTDGAVAGENGIRYTAGDENIPGSDINLLKAKFQQLYDAGVRSFGLLLDDCDYGPRTLHNPWANIYNPNEPLTEEVLAETTAIVNIMADWCAEKGDCYDLIFCPASYNLDWMKNGFKRFYTQAYQYQEVSYYDLHFRENVAIITTGTSTFSDTDQSIADRFKREGVSASTGYASGAERRNPLMWTNYPTVDSDNVLDFGPQYNLRTDLNPEDFYGLMSNPFQWAQMNKTVIPSICQYTWNLKDFDAEEVYEAQMKYVMDTEELAEAMLVLAEHNDRKPFAEGNGEGTQALKSAIAAFQASITKENAEAVLAEINDVVAACDALLTRENYTTVGMYEQLYAYASALHDLSACIQSYMRMFDEDSDVGALKYDANELYASHSTYAVADVTGVDKYAVTGTLTLLPFANWLRANEAAIMMAAAPDAKTMAFRVEDTNAADIAPVSVELAVNGKVRSTGLLPVELYVEEGDVITAKATLLNAADYAFVNWTVGDTVVGETLDLTYTVSAEDDLVINLDWIGPDNLAQGKPVTASQVNGSWAAANLTDGVLSHLGGNTGWSSTSLGKNTTFAEHTAVIDLGAETQMNAFRLYGRTDCPEGVVNYPVSYTIYTSSDNRNWTPVYTVTGGEVPPCHVPAVIRLEQDVTARYVKLGVTAVNRGDESDNVYVQLSELGVYYDRFSDQNLADQVMALIDAVSVEDKASMEAARAAYDALTDRQKTLVTNLAKLEEAELYWNTVHTPVSLVLTGADAINAFDESVTYTLSGQDMHNLATMVVSMEITDEYLTDPVVEPAAGWMVVAQAWRDGVLSVAVCNNTGANGDGDILTITLKPNEVAGSASITLTDADLSAYLGDGETLVQVDLDGASITTEVRHNIFDVNKDGVVDQLDMTRAQRYYGTDNTDADVNEDGTVDLDDLILILNNYHEAFE